VGGTVRDALMGRDDKQGLGLGGGGWLSRTRWKNFLKTRAASTLSANALAFGSFFPRFNLGKKLHPASRLNLGERTAIDIALPRTEQSLTRAGIAMFRF